MKVEVLSPLRFGEPLHDDASENESRRAVGGGCGRLAGSPLYDWFHLGSPRAAAPANADAATGNVSIETFRCSWRGLV